MNYRATLLRQYTCFSDSRIKATVPSGMSLVPSIFYSKPQQGMLFWLIHLHYNDWLEYILFVCSVYCAGLSVTVTLVCLTLISYQVVQIYNIRVVESDATLLFAFSPADGALTSFPSPTGFYQSGAQTLPDPSPPTLNVKIDLSMLNWCFIN